MTSMFRLLQQTIWLPRIILRQIGRSSIRAVSEVAYVVGVIVSCLSLALKRSSWPQTVRDVFARQLLFTAVDGAQLSVRISIAVGILLVVQTQLWLEDFGSDSDPATPFLMTVIVRELGPLIASLVVLGRSGSAITTELANMRIRGEVDVLDAQGIEPMIYLVMPRLLSMAISIFLLALIVVIVMFTSGYVVGVGIGAVDVAPTTFFGTAIADLTLVDFCFFIPKTIFAGLFVGAILCIEGLHVRGAATEISRVVSRGAVRGLTAVFFVSAILSLLISGRILIFKVF